MIEKPKRPKKIPNQDNKQPQTIEQLIKRYDLDNTKIYDFLDELVTEIKNELTSTEGNITKLSNRPTFSEQYMYVDSSRFTISVPSGKSILLYTRPSGINIKPSLALITCLSGYGALMSQIGSMITNATWTDGILTVTLANQYATYNYMLLP